MKWLIILLFPASLYPMCYGYCFKHYAANDDAYTVCKNLFRYVEAKDEELKKEAVNLSDRAIFYNKYKEDLCPLYKQGRDKVCFDSLEQAVECLSEDYDDVIIVKDKKAKNEKIDVFERAPDGFGHNTR